jgi:hypothetical protein
VVALLSYGTIILNEDDEHHSLFSRNEVQFSGSSCGGDAYYKVGVIPDGDDFFFAVGYGKTVDEAFERCIENARRRPEYLAWVEAVHAAVTAEGQLTIEDESDVDVFVHDRAPNKVTSTIATLARLGARRQRYFFEDANVFGEDSRRFNKRYRRRFIRREVRTQLRDV